MEKINEWLERAQSRSDLLDSEASIGEINTILQKDLPRLLAIAEAAVDVRNELLNLTDILDCVDRDSALSVIKNFDKACKD